MNHDNHPNTTGLEVAIIGTALRVPGADDVETFWHNLLGGVCSIKPLTREGVIAKGVDPELAGRPEYLLADPMLEKIEYFDAAFFSISPREATVMDPQQRLFLQLCWQTLEDAGYDPARFEAPMGIYAGVRASKYVARLLMTPETAALGSMALWTANDKDYIANKVAYKLDLGGPAVCVQSACSTSLVAIHLAC